MTTFYYGNYQKRYRPRSLPMLERLQQQFENACIQGNLSMARQALDYGASMSGRGLGLAARGPIDLTVFRWLLQKNCPVTTDTWKIIAGSVFSIVYARAISRHYGRAVLFEAGKIAAFTCDAKLFKFVIEQVGWQVEFMTALIWSSSNDATIQYNLIQWAVNTFDVDLTTVPPPPNLLSSGMHLSLERSSDSLSSSGSLSGSDERMGEGTFEVIDVN